MEWPSTTCQAILPEVVLYKKVEGLTAVDVLPREHEVVAAVAKAVSRPGGRQPPGEVKERAFVWDIDRDDSVGADNSPPLTEGLLGVRKVDQQAGGYQTVERPVTVVQILGVGDGAGDARVVSKRSLRCLD